MADRKIDRPISPRRPPHFVDPIFVGFDRLQILLEQFKREIGDRFFWLTPGGIFLSLAATLVVSDFKDRFGLRGSDWRTGAVLLTIVFAGLTIWTLIKALRYRSMDSWMSTICASSVAPPRHYALLLFRARNKNGVNKLLVYRDEVWGCYLLPFVSLQPDQTDPDDVSEPAADRFGLPKEGFHAREIAGCEFRETKTSEASRNLTNYYFAFYRMVVDDKFGARFRPQDFEIHGRKYSWLTIEEIMSDAQTATKNGGVFRHVRDNGATFFDGGAPLSITASLGA